MTSRRTRNALVALGAVFSVSVAAAALLRVVAPSDMTATMTFTPTADTYVDNLHPTTNFGTSTQLGVDKSEVKNLFLTFDLSAMSGTITSAKLRLHVDDSGSAASTTGGTYKLMSNTAWSETGPTYNHQPAIDGALLGTLGNVGRNSWVELDVTGKITAGGTLSIAGYSTSTNGADYDSRETGATAPQLVIAMDTPPGTTPLATPAPPPATTPLATTTPPPSPRPTTSTGQSSGDPVLVGAGDISNSGTGDSATAALINSIPGTVFTTGDNVYDGGTPSEFNTYYNPTWGQFKARTKPAPGNHEYHTADAAGYFGYFFGGQTAGNEYYSYDLGNWHIVSLNSEIAHSAGSAQETWLRNDLANNTRPCTLAYWHKPLFTSGANHSPDTSQRPLFQALYDSNADVVVAGHNHQYERFAPMNPTGGADPTRGIRQFVAGMGGGSHYSFGTIQPNSEARNSDTYGVLKLTLHSNSYDWQFVPEAGKTYGDSGTTACH
ncbi:DNRLRE domain-containing protein [Terrabacter sp. GCM10028922]|uniref:CBM96 family carbohydrate-binding protein n=1 Tax=Terrabacter sp. GCM10028922 TaxID=3273428 RepID=UPI0036121BBA